MHLPNCKYNQVIREYPRKFATMILKDQERESARQQRAFNLRAHNFWSVEVALVTSAPTHFFRRLVVSSFLTLFRKR